MIVFLDANILFAAAHKPIGKSAKLIKLCADQEKIRIVTCDTGANEARRNLALKYPQGLTELDSLLRDMTCVTIYSGLPCPIPLNPKDAILFASAIQLGATHFLTGDLGDFGPYMNDPGRSAGILIQTVREFINSNLEEYPFLIAAQETRAKYRADFKKAIRAGIKVKVAAKEGKTLKERRRTDSNASLPFT